MTTPAYIRFKALPSGRTFTHDATRYRKASGSTAYALNANGTGRTHERVKFARNTFVQPV